MTKIKNISALLHKKSAVSGKTPTASQLEYGELAVNYNSDSPFISLKDSDDNIVKIVPADNVTALTVDNVNQKILLDKVNADGTVQQLSGNAENIVFESDVKDGLEVDNHLVKVKLKTGEKVLTVDTGGVESHISLSAATSVANGAATLSTILSGNTQQINSITHKISSGNGISISGGTTGVTVSAKIDANDKILSVGESGIKSTASLSANTSVSNGVGTYTTVLSGISSQISSVTHKISSGNGITVAGSSTGVTVSAKIDSTSASGLTVSANGIKLSGDTTINSASTNVVQNKTIYTQLDGLKFKHLTQAEYDALATKDNMTVYIITDN